ncbi:MAG: AraC family transcriptional regulator [Eubacteriales bacterium]|nr:AraC family transcriptional regulator [Eubacteriales bacterium]
MFKFNCTAIDNSEFPFTLDHYPQFVGLSLVTRDPNWSHPMHSHKEYTDIVLVNGGRSRILCGRTSCVSQKGDILIFNRGVLHDEHSIPSDPLESLGISVSNFEFNCKEGFLLVKSGSQYSLLSSMFAQILDSCSLRSAGFEETCQRLTVTILLLTLWLIDQQKAEDPMDLYRKDSTLGVRMKEYFDQFYYQKFTLKDIEDTFHFNSYYLSHVFKQATGFSPMQYIINRRVGEAQNLLLTTDMSIVDIARHVGYTNINHFYSVFKKYKGMPPKAFREYYKRESSNYLRKN